MKCLFAMVLLGAVCSTTAMAQSALSDKSGAGTFAAGGRVVSFNAGDASLTGNVGHFRKDPKADTIRFWNISAKFGATGGISSLYDGSKFKPTVDLGFILGKTNKKLRTWYGGVKFSSTFFNLLKSDQSNTFADRVFAAPTLTAGYNKIGSIKPLSNLPFILGVTLNFSVLNNLSDLKAVDVYQNISVTANDTTKTLLQDKKSGYSGNYHTTGTFLLNFDFYVYPDFLGNQIGIGGYGRLRAIGYQPRQNLGVGILMGGAGAPSNVAFGLLYQFNDIGNQLGKQNEFLKRGGVNLVAGYKF